MDDLNAHTHRCDGISVSASEEHASPQGSKSSSDLSFDVFKRLPLHLDSDVCSVWSLCACVERDAAYVGRRDGGTLMRIAPTEMLTCAVC